MTVDSWVSWSGGDNNNRFPSSYSSPMPSATKAPEGTTPTDLPSILSNHPQLGPYLEKTTSTNDFFLDIPTPLASSLSTFQTSVTSATGVTIDAATSTADGPIFDTPSAISGGQDLDSPNAEEGFFDRFSEGTKAAIIISIIFGVVAIVIASIWFCCGKPRRQRLKAQEAMQLHRERAEAEARSNNTQRPLGSSVQDLNNRNSTGQLAMREMRPTSQPSGSIAPVQARGAVGRTSRHLSLRGGGGSDAPPRYEEVVPPAHKRLAGGMVQRNDQIQPVEDDDGAGLVADGKTPLSEIPFEDVVLNRDQSGEGSSSAPLSFGGPEGGRDFHARHAARGGDTSGHSNV